MKKRTRFHPTTVSVTVTSKQVLRLPNIPSTIQTDMGAKLCITELTEEQLNELGKAWTRAIVSKRSTILNERSLKELRAQERASKVIANRGNKKP